MELLNNIWGALTTPNETLTSIVTIPLFFVENTLILYLILSIFKIEVAKKSKIIYVLIASFVGIISNFLIPIPINSILNYIALIILAYFTFSMTKIKTLIAVILPTIIFALVSNLLSNPFIQILNISSNDLLTVPIYRVIYLTTV